MHESKKTITVTKPSLPPLDEYVELLRDIWDREWLTNKGRYHDELESSLAKYLDVPYVSLFCNGMIALQVGLQALKITGEVITTPYSFVATTHALWWNHCTPVFCDIDPVTCNLDPARVESLITPRTTAILPVHIYGTPCDTVSLQKIADTYGLRLLYDAAHAFGVRVNNTSVLTFGDMSMVSFHATKVFNTAEGGALITTDLKLKQRVDYLKNFGFADEVTVIAPGTNGKMNELQAALGVVQLRHINREIERRQEIDALYRERLSALPGIRLMQPLEGATQNYAYFPIFVDDSEYPISRDALYAALKTRGLLGRRYFYPLISEFPTYRELPSSTRLPTALTISRQVLCLPLYSALDHATAKMICAVIRDTHDVGSAA